jgi:trehalose-6-phosphatase
VIEVRARGVNKGVYLEGVLAAAAPDPGIFLAAGDDATDNDLFRVLPDGSIAIHVGGIRQGARRTPLEHEYVVENPAALRAALREIALGGPRSSEARLTKDRGAPARLP